MRLGPRRRADFVICAMLATASIGAISCDAPGKPPPNAEEAEEGNATDFKGLFARNCSGCHGEEGKNGPGRILHDSLYLAVMPKEELRRTIAHGRPGTSMPAWSRAEGGALTDKQINVLVEGIETNWSKPAPPATPPLPPYSAPSDSGDVKRGKLVFAQSCVLCHRPGVIGPVTDPSYLSLVTDQNIRTSIIVGRPDLGMPSYRNLKLGRPLTNQDISDVVTYLASLRPANTIPVDAYAQASGTGQSGEKTKGNEDSGNRPGRDRDEQRQEGHKGNSGSSIGAGGLGEKGK
ncbi:MAG: c-type cytochrome [Bryobacteraceae bacterium]